MAQEGCRKLCVKNRCGGRIEEIGQGLEVFAAGMQHLQDIVALQEASQACLLPRIEREGIEQGRLPGNRTLEQRELRIVGVRALKFRIEDPQAVVFDGL